MRLFMQLSLMRWKMKLYFEMSPSIYNHKDQGAKPLLRRNGLVDAILSVPS